MGGLFGKPKSEAPKNEPRVKTQQQVSSKDKAILELKNARDRLKKYRARLEIDLNKLTEQAKAHIRAQQRDRAMMLLKFKRHKQKTVEEINGQLLTILQQIEDVEWAAISVQVFGALKTGTNLLNKIHEELSIDQVAALLDETNEAIEVENQINQLLAGQFSSVDESDLLAELDQLTGSKLEVSNNSLSTASELPEAPEGDIIILPSVPEHEITAPEATENKILTPA